MHSTLNGGLVNIRFGATRRSRIPTPPVVAGG